MWTLQKCTHFLLLFLLVHLPIYTYYLSHLQDISTVEIICAECPTPFKFCLECLASGVEAEHAPEHKRTHAYSVTENLAIHRLFDHDWTAEDEMALLDGLAVCGIGNWFEIAAFLGTGRTEKDIERHFHRVYIDSTISPLPSASWMQVSGGAAGLASGAIESISASSDNTLDSSNATTTGNSASSTKSGRGRGRAAQGGGETPTSARNFGHVAATPGYSSAHVPRTEIVGYLPLRGDFDVEWENDAETVVADIEFVEGEHAVERELKLKLLEIYNAKLDERERRKAFVIERGLLDYKRLTSAERRRPKEEKEVYDVLRPFARFLTPTGFEDLARAVILEQRLRRRIIQLQEYKQKGITTLAEAADYESQRKKGTAASTLPPGSFTAEGLSKMADGLILEVQGALEGLAPNKRTRDSLLASAVLSHQAEEGENVLAVDEDGGGSAAGMTLDSTSTLAVQSPPVVPSDLTNGSSVPSTSTQSNLQRGPSQELLKRARHHFDASVLPGANRLTETELSLCQHLYLTPRLYEQVCYPCMLPFFNFIEHPCAMLPHLCLPFISVPCYHHYTSPLYPHTLISLSRSQIKLTLLNISLTRGAANIASAKELLVHVEVQKIEGVLDFVVKMGWVSRAQEQV